MYTCKCKNMFCSKHMHKHECSVNYKELFKKNNKKVIKTCNDLKKKVNLLKYNYYFENNN